jgi:hypothetical protein
MSEHVMTFTHLGEQLTHIEHQLLGEYGRVSWHRQVHAALPVRLSMPRSVCGVVGTERAMASSR